MNAITNKIIMIIIILICVSTFSGMTFVTESDKLREVTGLQSTNFYLATSK